LHSQQLRAFHPPLCQHSHRSRARADSLTSARPALVYSVLGRSSIAHKLVNNYLQKISRLIKWMLTSNKRLLAGAKVADEFLEVLDLSQLCKQSQHNPNKVHSISKALLMNFWKLCMRSESTYAAVLKSPADSVPVRIVGHAKCCAVTLRCHDDRTTERSFQPTALYVCLKDHERGTIVPPCPQICALHDKSPSHSTLCRLITSDAEVHVKLLPNDCPWSKEVARLAALSH